jgi:hypothetical protein
MGGQKIEDGRWKIEGLECKAGFAALLSLLAKLY